MNNKRLAKTLAPVALLMGSSAAMAACPNITYDQLTTALKASVHTTTPAITNGGLDFNMWATVVGTDGTVCLVTKTGAGLNDQWLLSRVISAQKANTAVGLSTSGPTGFALSTANLWTAVQPGGSLFGLQHSNPVDTASAYSGNSAAYGTSGDPLRGRKVGGVNVFGGGLPLYDATNTLVGALGVSGDTSCADHNVAWRTRENLAGFTSANVPAGVNSLGGATHPGRKDNIVYVGEQPAGFAHASCGNNEQAVNNTLFP